MSRELISIIIPTHNNAATLALVLLDIRHHLERLQFRHEIIIVDDQSHDGTLEVARRFSLLMKSIHVVDYRGGPGFGAAVRHGLTLAHGDWMFVFPASGEACFDEIEKMLFATRDPRTPIVVGARQFFPQLHILRRFFTILHTLLVRVITGIALRDPLSLCFLLRGDAAAVIVPKLMLRSDAAVLEIVFRGVRLGYRFVEVPVLWHRRRFPPRFFDSGVITDAFRLRRI